MSKISKSKKNKISLELILKVIFLIVFILIILDWEDFKRGLFGF
ncbi:hypothetical protein BC962_3274 [Gillisia mitskevichiae]|uniref:Uncharacterized protein n=1 Tax=Gillisia mitskevichiae TaxID=270921 RepID=A0A495NXC7_9FLAO|nr:hypothetical protein BC962_3274 [Gillisia mitskevichiae]